MRLYHGTNTDFDTIDLKMSRRSKDFGQGFYLSDNYSQAEEMAKHRTKQEGGDPLVLEYEFEETQLADLKVRRFEGYTEEWVRFIMLNRDNRTETPAHDYDIVVGPIADDTIGLQLFQFRKHYINIKTLIANLRYKKLTFQYFFGTDKAITYLKRI